MTFAGLIFLAGLAPMARANCVELPKPGSKWAIGAARLALAPRANTAYGRSNTSSAGNGPQIVGLWQFEFTSLGNSDGPLHIPDGAVLDAGYAQWHSDGTEIMNSSRDPVTGNFCLGVWEAVGGRTYRLNHFGLSWDNTGHLCQPTAGSTSCFVGPANIREEVSVNPDGDAYEGTVTIDQYDTAQHVMVHLGGRVTAHRITP
jgi:hypothetical protein